MSQPTVELLATEADPSTWIGSAEVARRLKRSPSLIPSLIHSGRLRPCMRAPGRRGAFLFDPAEVDRYIEARDKHDGFWEDEATP